MTRFVHILSLMEEENIPAIFQLETDNLLLRDPHPYFRANNWFDYGMAIVMDNMGDNGRPARGIGSFTYVGKQDTLRRLLAWHRATGLPMIDMEWLGHIRKEPDVLSLPVTPHMMQRDDEWDCMFDGAALGAYYFGCDGRYGQPGPGFINETAWYADCIPSWPLSTKEWTIAGVPLINLHVSCKRADEIYPLVKLEPFREWKTTA